MPTLRTTWLAVMGAILLVTLSVSAAFGAKPTDTDGPRGQSIAAFVHELVFGSETDDEESEQTDEDQEEDSEDEENDEESEDANETDEDTEEDAEESEDGDQEDEELVTDDSERQVPEEFANHGECVADATHDTDGFEGSDAENFGAWVSMHARYVCWGLEPPTDETDEAAVEDDEEDVDEASANEQRKAEKAAARAERRAEREAAKAERMAAHAAAKAERFAARAAAKAARGH